MPSIQITTGELLDAVNQLPLAELDDFIRQVIALRAKYDSPTSDGLEAALLEKINRRLPTEAQIRYDELKGKRRDETLTEDEYNELLSISETIENQQVERVRNLIELALLRKVTVPDLVKSLGDRPEYE